MKSQMQDSKKKTMEQKQDTTAQGKPMFQSRPFVVQSQSDQLSQPNDMKTSLKQAERYGHHVSQMQPIGVSAPKAVQQKKDASSEGECIQRASREGSMEIEEKEEIAESSEMGAQKNKGKGRSNPEDETDRPRTPVSKAGEDKQGSAGEAQGEKEKAPWEGRQKYKEGSYGGTEREQKRLNTIYEDKGVKVTGDNFESEHAIGYGALAKGVERGSSKMTDVMENHAPAYQELKDAHRGHQGTGNRGGNKEVPEGKKAKKDPKQDLVSKEFGYEQHVVKSGKREEGFGVKSERYDDDAVGSKGYQRDQRRLLVEGGDASASVQLGQLGYAHLPDEEMREDVTDGSTYNRAYQKIKNEAKGDESKVPGVSFNHMVDNMERINYAKVGEGEMEPGEVQVSPYQREEMKLARKEVDTGVYTTEEEMSEALKAANRKARVEEKYSDWVGEGEKKSLDEEDQDKGGKGKEQTAETSEEKRKKEEETMKEWRERAAKKTAEIEGQKEEDAGVVDIKMGSLFEPTKQGKKRKRNKEERKKEGKGKRR